MMTVRGAGGRLTESRSRMPHGRQQDERGVARTCPYMVPIDALAGVIQPGLQFTRSRAMCLRWMITDHDRRLRAANYVQCAQVKE
jgi:hypothetical protein